MTMVLKQGKFYINNVEIPIEFGNADQIRLYKREQQNMDELTEGVELDFEVDTVHTYSAQIKCICGYNVFFEQEDDDDDNRECLADNKRSCNKCKREYKTYMENGELMVKLNN